MNYICRIKHFQILDRRLFSTSTGFPGTQYKQQWHVCNPQPTHFLPTSNHLQITLNSFSKYSKAVGYDYSLNPSCIFERDDNSPILYLPIRHYWQVSRQDISQLHKHKPHLPFCNICLSFRYRFKQKYYKYMHCDFSIIIFRHQAKLAPKFSYILQSAACIISPYVTFYAMSMKICSDLFIDCEYFFVMSMSFNPSFLPIYERSLTFFLYHIHGFHHSFSCRNGRFVNQIHHFDCCRKLRALQSLFVSYLVMNKELISVPEQTEILVKRIN